MKSTEKNARKSCSSCHNGLLRVLSNPGIQTGLGRKMVISEKIGCSRIWLSRFVDFIPHQCTKQPNTSHLASLLQSILASLLSLPSPKLPSAYYHSVLTELCRLSPQTVAPSLGKCVRKLYAGLGADVDDGFPVLEAEGVRRFAEWFATHLSNFGFMWGWADWFVRTFLLEC